MKWTVAVLVTVVIVLTGAVLWLAWPQPVTAAEVLKATGGKYWCYRIPDSYKPNQNIGIGVTTGGNSPPIGGASGFQPGQLVKVFLFPSDDGKTFKWSIVDGNTTVSSTVSNPFKDGSSGYGHLPIGSTLRDNVLMQGIVREGEGTPPTIRIIISD